MSIMSIMGIAHVAHCRHLASSLLFLTLAATALASGPAPKPGTTSTSLPAATSASSQSYPQIVRISLMQGDVRIARGEKGATWEKATADLPLETGFNLVTGNDGRVEIEFEDASTAYLGENSVLSFNELSTNGGVPRSDMTLLSGTLSVRFQPTMPDEWYVVRTPTDHFAVDYPNRPFVRINSYVDAMKVTAESETTFHFAGELGKQDRKGETATFRSGQLESLAALPEDAKAFADFDGWVNQRVATRDAAQAAVMQEANLPAPVPGLAEMQGQGRFFPCAPYGTCWEPDHGWDGAQPASAQPDTDTAAVMRGGFGRRAAAGYLAGYLGGYLAGYLQVAQISGADPDEVDRQLLDEDLFPCSPFRVRHLISTDPATGLRQTADLGLVPAGERYTWAVCHTGSWIRQGHRYAWVAGTKRHHRCPVHWVKYGHVRGFVPIHPRDVAGKPPLNLQHGVFVPIEKRGTLERVAFHPDTSIKLLGGPPKEFARLERPTLQRAEEPRPEAHRVAETGRAGGKDLGGRELSGKELGGKDSGKAGMAGARRVGTPITFDHRSQSFVLTHPVTQGGRTVTLAEHFGGGSIGGRSGGGGGSARSGGGSFGSAGGGGSRGGGGGGASGGGGGHASGGASSGGGMSSSGGSSGGAHK
ncbi:MAG TPA: hypothetical protein VGG96_06345 [Steroidobacteraceae bacterium]|jgi:hypothetical protein